MIGFFISFDGKSVILSRGESVEIELNEMSKDMLIYMITQMADKNMTPHEYFNYALQVS